VTTEIGSSSGPQLAVQTRYLDANSLLLVTLVEVTKKLLRYKKWPFLLVPVAGHQCGTPEGVQRPDTGRTRRAGERACWPMRAGRGAGSDTGFCGGEPK
jgi:hypothetical protein